MLKPPIAALIALSLICSSHADAQDQPTPEAVATAKELIVTLRISDEFVRSLPGMLQVIKALIIRGRPEIELDFDAAAPVVLDAMKARVNELLEPIVDIYVRNFTVSEMRELVAFYRTPAGQKFLDKSSIVTQEMTTIGQKHGQCPRPRMHERMIEEIRKRGQKL
jgi:hypothetical protein